MYTVHCSPVRNVNAYEIECQDADKNIGLFSLFTYEHKYVLGIKCVPVAEAK